MSKQMVTLLMVTTGTYIGNCETTNKDGQHDFLKTKSNVKGQIENFEIFKVKIKITPNL